MAQGLIIGGGASGLMAAIAAAEQGASVTLIDHMPRVGKKILSTGNGKCNLTNLFLSADGYRCPDPAFPMQVIDAFPVSETLQFFRRLGVFTTDRNGYVYPASGQAQTVLDALRERAEELGVKILTDCKVNSAVPVRKGFAADTGAGPLSGRFIILATGSMAAKSTGSDGSGYDLARSFGHTVRKPLPALVQLRCGGISFPSVSGVRTEAKVSLYALKKGAGGKSAYSLLASDTGEVQLTDYGISGIPVFQVSRFAAEALDRRREVIAVLDFWPKETEERVLGFLAEQRNFLKNRRAEGFLNGMFNKKLASLFLKTAGIDRSLTVGRLSDPVLKRLAALIKNFEVTVLGTNSYDQAQICMGGVSVSEVNPATMESRLVPGLYLAGELLDVDGICGGYNLQWAWSSGRLAGLCAAKHG